MTAPTAERVAALRVLLLEAARSGHAGNGARLPDDLTWLAVHDAVRSPGTAARCPNLRAVLPLEVAAAVTRLAGLPVDIGRHDIYPPPVSRLTRCESCGGELDPACRADKRYCSARCRQRAKRRRDHATQ